MTDRYTPQDIQALAHAVGWALVQMNDGQMVQFALIVAVPHADGEHIQLKTISNIEDAENIRQIAHHLLDMANEQEPSLDPFEDLDVRGHA